MLQLTENEAFTPWFKPADLPSEVRSLFEFGASQAIPLAPAIVAIGGRSAVIAPRFCGSEGKQSSTLATIRTLLTARREHGRRSAMAVHLDLVNAFGDNADDLARLEAALSLWADYSENGDLYLTTTRISPRERGRIRWPETLRTPVAMSGLSTVYPGAVHSQVGIVPRHPLTILHQKTCAAAGQLLGIRSSGPKNLDPGESLRTLDRYANSLFQDRHRRVCHELRRFHSARGNERGETMGRFAGCIATSFPNIWERMVQVMLGPHFDVPLPKGTYALTSGGGSSGLRMRPDLVVRESSQTLVIDAKDYALGTWPRAESINKQIMYRLFMTHAFGGPLDPMHVHNMFVRPHVLAEGQSVEYLGCHNLSTDPQAAGVIHCLGIDFASAANAYSRGRPVPRARSALLQASLRPRVSEPPERGCRHEPDDTKSR